MGEIEKNIPLIKNLTNKVSNSKLEDTAKAKVLEIILKPITPENPNEKLYNIYKKEHKKQLYLKRVKKQFKF